MCGKYPYPMVRVKYCDKLANAYETGSDRMDVNEDSDEPVHSTRLIRVYSISTFKVRKHMHERYKHIQT